jgi:hypothetical protein
MKERTHGVEDRSGQTGESAMSDGPSPQIKYVELDAAIHAIAPAMRLPEIFATETRLFESISGTVDWECDYSYACRYSAAAATLHQFIANTETPARWWSMQPETGMPIIGAGAEEGMAALARVGRLVRDEETAASAHRLATCWPSGAYFDEHGQPCRVTRRIDLDALLGRMGGFYWIKAVGLVGSDLASLVAANSMMDQPGQDDHDGGDRPALGRTQLVQPAATAAEPRKAKPLPSSEIAEVFDGLHFRDWKTRLEDRSKWMEQYLHSPGRKGHNGAESLWDPIGLAQELILNRKLVSDGPARTKLREDFTRRFRNHEKLARYREDWNDLISLMFAPD